MADLPNSPVTRQEEYLSRLAGEDTTLPREPLTREEMYLEGAIGRIEAVEQEVQQIKDNPDVADIVGTYDDLEHYDTSTLTDKDIIRVLADETQDGESTYYRWDATNEEFDYIGTSGATVKVLTNNQYNALWSGGNALNDILSNVISGAGV